MYHISDDIRAQQSANRICEAVLQCAKHKSFSEITIADLHKKYFISRTTFYRLFDNLVDVLEYRCEQMGKSILLNVQGETLREVTINATYALTDQWEFISLLSKSGHLDIFEKVGEKYLPFSKLTQGTDFGTCSAYFYRILSQIIPMTVDIWVNEGQKDSPEEICEKLCKSIEILNKWFSE